MLVTMITSTLCDIWIENAPLNDDPCKLLAFTTSKWLFLSLFVPKLLRPTICDCYESIWIYFGPYLKQFAVLLLDILVRKIFHENETGVQFEDDKGENYVSLPVTGFDKGWRAIFFTFLDNDIFFSLDGFRNTWMLGITAKPVAGSLSSGVLLVVNG